MLPDHSHKAEQCLSRAIKRAPSLVDAWNALGVCYWKAKNMQQAYDCFNEDLVHVSSCTVLEFVHLDHSVGAHSSRDYEGSYCTVTCFVTLSQSKNKESLRNVSMVLRQIGKGI